MQQNRRAAPPRPSLLVGDLQGCYVAFEALQEEVLRLEMEESASLSDQASTDASAWGRLVPRCRSIRETLTSVHELSDFTRQVYECSADICMRAGDLGEALKCLRQLVDIIYTSLAAASQHARHTQQEQQQQAAAPAVAQPAQRQSAPGSSWGRGAAERRCEGGFISASLQHAGLLRRPAAGAAGGRPAGQGAPAPGATAASAEKLPTCQQSKLSSLTGDGDDGALASVLAAPAFLRWPEMAAALLLYYKCCGRRQEGGEEGLDTVITLRRMPGALLRCEEVQLALRLEAALAAGDFVGVFRLLCRAPRMVQLAVRPCLDQVRQQALACMAAAYRNIEAAAVARMLGIHGQPSSGAMLTALKALADKGHRGAQVALGNAQTSDGAGPLNLVFK